MATGTPSSMINALSEVIEEKFSQGIKESMPKLDSLYPELTTTSFGVNQSEIGGPGSTGGFKVIHTFEEGVAGYGKWVAPGGTAPEAGYTHVLVPKDSDAYPGLSSNVSPGHFPRTISLARYKGNFFVPIEFFKADTLSASIGKSG